MRVSSLRSIKANYKHLMEFYDTFSSTDYSATAQAKGFLSKMQSFDFLFFLNFSIALLGPIEILNGELQSPKLSVVDSYKKINLTVDLLKGTKETLFEKIWIECQTEMEELDVNDPFCQERESCHLNWEETIYQYRRRNHFFVTCTKML